jgi:3-oxoacyl-[acyl-carrier protein] reductase
MDLGIAGRRALVCAASEGLGKACAMSLATNGVDVVVTGRTPEKLAAAKADIEAASGRTVVTVAGDITTEQGRAAALQACPEPTS